MIHTQHVLAVALTLAAIGAGSSEFRPSTEAQKPTVQKPAPQSPAPQEPATKKPAPQRQRPPQAPSIGQAVPRRPPQVRPRPGRGRLPIPHPYAYRYRYPGVNLGFWYGYPYTYGYFGMRGPLIAVPGAQAGAVRLEVTPKDAEVYVDGYYAGIVDDFDGPLNHLALVDGPHTIEVRKARFETIVVEVYVQVAQTITFRETMQPDSSEGADDEASAEPPGDLRLDVTPIDAQVYVDGFYAGIVDDFRHGQRLELAAGPHHVELRAIDRDPLVFDIIIESRKTADYHGTLPRIQPPTGQEGRHD